MMFQALEGDCAVIVEGGVYKQADLYARNGFLFAKAGGGFVRLYADGSTSKPKCRIDTISTEKALFSDPLGRICDGSVNKAKPVEGDKAQKLLGVSDG